jgi:hypothetical protein
VFRLYEEGGGWTRLSAVGSFAKMVITNRFLIGIEAREPAGSFILDDVESGELDSEYVLWGRDRLITAFDFDSETRGVFNGRNIRSTIRSRPLPGFGHEVRFWHRFGVRAKGNWSCCKSYFARLLIARSAGMTQEFAAICEATIRLRVRRPRPLYRGHLRRRV